MFVPNAKTFLSGIRELKDTFSIIRYSVFITFKCTVVNHIVIPGIFKLHTCIFHNLLHF